MIRNIRWLAPALLIVLSWPPAAPAQPRHVARPIVEQALPHRVHVQEDFETEIERRWWLRGEARTDNPPASLSPSLPNTRYLAATESKNFDRKMEDQQATYKAVIFNPVPGPPMGSRTRLRFRYRLSGTDALRVQIYSLTNNYHRYLTLTDLPQDRWQLATVDMTAARRPDGSGGPLAADERIDDIQFYVPTDAELLIDDIVLYEAAGAGEQRPFPRRMIFTAWFDTGKQGEEWPGDFEIVLHDPPRGWDAAQSIQDPRTGKPRLRVGLRGERALGQGARLVFRYQLKGPELLRVSLVNSKTGERWEQAPRAVISQQWSEAAVQFETEAGDIADEIHFTTADEATLRVDDLLLYEQ
jgi:hypothetical protein